MSNEFSGSYPLEPRKGEIDRLNVQALAMAPETSRMLDLIGVGEGWKCLDIGCGPGGITGLLSERVGSKGHVVGLDMNADFLEYARATAPANTEFLLGDAYDSALTAETFDLVHMRFVASTAGAPERLLREATRLAKSRGTIALQEPDGSTLNCYPPHPSWDKLKDALLGAFRGVGADLELARRLYYVIIQSGLTDVQYRPFIIGVRSVDSMVDYLPSTVESLRSTVLQLGLLEENEFTTMLSACRAHLARSETVFTMYTVAQVWGRKP
ncbi:methyltransferase domain-containing protein [Filomicrobium sp.]|uniref:class I SAM-dependent methyltransferase n=1 Tax=Filomicrobium sp. TaxID=2024831 RepID=UPI00258AF2CC|nr:methyltransferase domain-containing protein [Filomicrobium sp.]MCV0370681.1 methyltransferase domain-containing protein [Filomicrobium sp.]